MVQRGGVDVDPPDFAVAGRRGVDVADAVGNELGVVVRMLAEDQDQPLMSLLFQRQHLLADFVSVQGATDHFPIRAAERAVSAIVGTFVADVKRGKKHDAVAVNVALQPPGGGEDFLDHLRPIGRQQYGRLVDRERLLGQALGDHFVELPRLDAKVQQGIQSLLVDEVEPAAAEFVLVDLERHSPSLT